MLNLELYRQQGLSEECIDTWVLPPASLAKEVVEPAGTAAVASTHDSISHNNGNEESFSCSHTREYLHMNPNSTISCKNINPQMAPSVTVKEASIELRLGLQSSNCMQWVEAMKKEYNSL